MGLINKYSKYSFVIIALIMSLGSWVLPAYAIPLITSPPAGSTTPTATPPATGSGGNNIMPSPPTGVPTDVADIVRKLFQVGIEAGAIIFLIMFLVGGIQYLSSSGNSDATGKAKTLMIDAIVGLILVLGAWALASFIGKQLGYPGF